MTSFAEQRFLAEARIARACGCFFVPNAWRGVAFDRCEVDFSSWYSAYVAVTVIVAVTGEVYLFVRQVSGPAAYIEDFFEKLYFAMHILVAVKILTNLSFFVAGNRTFVEALRDVKRLERSIGFRFPEEGSWARLRRRLRLVLFAVVVLCFGLSRAFTVVDVARDMAAPWFLPLATGAFSLLYGVVELMVVITERYFCVVLSRYVQFQVGRAHELLGGSGMFSTLQTTRDLVGAVDRLRASMAAVARIVRKVDDWLRFAVLVNFLISALSACVVAYAVVSTHISTEKLLCTAAYATLTCLSIADASLSAGDVKEQALKLKAVLDSVSVLNLPPRVTCQVELFSMTIDEKQLCFTGSGFFIVDRPMLTSFVGLVMTYSIIVVQTGRKPDTPRCQHHVGLA
ncbi:uncharacterized protein [Dermacentor albipictus]|uniref:uncharacterized protein n=1 Tax=Dermacentor albipictus TaxID=60249 RepID=UPI0038FCD9B0